MADVPPENAAPEPDSAGAQPRRRFRKWAKRGASVGLLVVLGGLLYLTQTARGQRLVLDELLGRVRGSFAGVLTVDGLRSLTLLTGLTLEGVRLEAGDGRPFLEADSLVVRYSPLSLLLGSQRLRSTTAFGLRAEISRYDGDDFTNLDLVLAESGAGDEAAVPPTTLQLGRIGIRGGLLEVLTPAEPGSDAPSVEGPSGGRLRRIAFEDVDLDLEETVVRPGGAVALDARLASLSASVSLLEKPLVIHEVFGAVAFGDRGLEIDDAAFRLPGGLFGGGLRFGPVAPGGAWELEADLEVSGWADLADLAWIDPRVPAGRFRGTAELSMGDAIEVRLTDVEAQTEASTLLATGGVRFAEGLWFQRLALTASPVDVRQLQPWVDGDLGVEGFVSGQVTLGGTVSDLSATGRLTLVPTGLGGASTTADFSGIVHSGADPGATDFEVRFDPINYRLFEAVWPGASLLSTGSGSLELNGRANRGILMVADLTHAADSATASRVVGRGVFRRTETASWVADVRGAVTPLSLPLLRRFWPELRLQGEVEGPVRVTGRLTDLTVTADLDSDAGRVSVNGGFDATAIGSAYRVRAQVEDLDVTRFSAAVPSPTVVSGRVDLQGSGLSLDSLAGVASLNLGISRVGGLRVDSVAAELRVADGILTADTLTAEGSGVRVSGRGSLGLVEGTSGLATLAFQTDSLLRLRPVFLGDSVLVRDGLNPLEEDLLRVRGIEPDTLPTELDVRMAGAARGTAEVRGRVGDVGLTLDFDLSRAAYGHNAVDSARVSLAADGLPELVGEWQVDVEADGLVWEGRDFERVDFDGAMVRRRGAGALDIVRDGSERYSLTGSFALDSLGGEAQLQDANMTFREMDWTLIAPTNVSWNTTTLSIDSLEIRREGVDPMRLTAAGRLARGGSSDFRLEMGGLHIEQVTRVLQWNDVAVEGHVDLSLTVLGPAERPVINALFQVEEPRFEAFELTRVSGSLEYEGRSADLRLDAWDGDRSILNVVGTVPIDLAFTEVEDRDVGEEMDLRVAVDSLDAAIPLAYLSALEDVVGTLSADVRVRGTTSDPAPSGSVYLDNAEWTLEALGVRHTGVSGELLMRPDRTVAVKLATTRTGTSTVAGTLNMVPFTNPTLDLSVAFDRFQAVRRRDMESTISGEFSLLGTYQLPVAQGTLRVDAGTLFVEEFARSSGVVDLRDPRLFSEGLTVDTTVFVAQPLIAGLRNPFLDNLRVDIDMAVPRNMWLRSDDMDVEMGGELLVAYDRGQGDLVLVGELEALRGSYLVVGRTFEVDGGTVSFIGQPGVNPELQIQATSRIRRREGEPLVVNATVEGTLIQPLVTLSSEEAGIAQSDLVSYLLFGRSSSELGGGAAGGGLGTGVGTLYTGALANQVLGNAAQDIGFDYFSFSQAGDFAGGASGFARSSQLEVGRYLGEDLFVILVLGGAPGQAASDDESGGWRLRGMRVEFPVADDFFFEGFLEDRFLRSGFAGLGASGLDGSQILGAFVFREWGYGRSQQQQDEE